jgi:hypothetical protein
MDGDEVRMLGEVAEKLPRQSTFGGKDDQGTSSP